MEEIEEFIEKYSKPLTKEEIKKVIYNTFALIIFLLPIVPEILQMGVYSLKNTIFNLVTVATSITLLLLNIKNVRLNVYDGLLVVYLFFVTLSTLFTKFGIIECILGTNGRGEGLVTIFSYAVTFIIFSRGYKYMTKISKAAIIAASIVSIYTIVQANVPVSIKLPFFKTRIKGVGNGTMTNQNFLSSYICIFLPMLSCYYINGKSKNTIFAVVLLFISLVFSKTLSGYLTIAFMYVVIVIFSICLSKNKKYTFKKICILTVTCLIAFACITNLKGNVYLKEIGVTKQEAVKLAKQDDSFGTGRMQIWQKTIKVISNFKLFGTGPDSLAKELNINNYLTKGNKDILNRYNIDKAHSEPLHIAATTGIPSAIIYLVLVTMVVIRLFIILIKNITNKGAEDNCTLCTIMITIGIISYFIQSLVNISVVQVAPIFWAILGIGAGITQQKKISTLK